MNIFRRFVAFYRTDKFKCRLENSKPKYMFELGDDHVIRYTRGREMEKMHELGMFTLFSDPPEDENLMSKKEFLSLPPLSPPPIRLRRKATPPRPMSRTPSL